MSVLQTSLQAPNVLIQPVRQHGGTDVLGPVPWDFSSNANACGPCPVALHAVQQANPQRYPDPGYTHLRSALAGLHGVAPERGLLAASASECIQRITAWRWRAGDRHFWTPPHAYGDYTHAAQAWGLQAIQLPDFSNALSSSNLLANPTKNFEAIPQGVNPKGQLRWLCDPGSPLGQSESAQTLAAVFSGLSSTASNQSGLTLQASKVTLVVDRAYAPLRLEGQSALSPEQLEQVWQLWSPNKALGLTGVRAAYAIAPLGAEADLLALDGLAASWPIGSHGEAMLHSWTLAETQQWVAQSRQTLAQWLLALRETLLNDGWTCAPTDTPYFCAQPPLPLDAGALRRHGIKCRDATSFGLPGWWRWSAQSPEALAALDAALKETLV